MPDYLHECRARHGAVTTALYGRRQDLCAIEKLAARIRERGILIYADIEAITDARLWAGGKFWQWPTREEFEERAEHQAVDVSTLPKGKGAIVKRLLTIFRNIEPVSVVLRFVDPQSFGILSPPVEKLLEIGPTHHPDRKYLRYIDDLRDLRDQRGFKTAAEVDMALWVLQEVLDALQSQSQRLGPIRNEYRSWQQAFREDTMLREIRVRNLTRSLFGAMELADLARALLPESRRRGGSIKRDQRLLAARIAGIEFERAVMRMAGRCPGDSARLRTVVSDLRIPGDVRQRWLEAVDVRNRAVHNGRVTRNDAYALADAMQEAIDWAARR